MPALNINGISTNVRFFSVRLQQGGRPQGAAVRTGRGRRQHGRVEPRAMVRGVLVQAAANNWNVEANTLAVADGRVIHAASNRSMHVGELVEAASKLPVPKSVTLKSAADYALIGKSHKRLDSTDKVNGKAMFGIDARLPNMGIATVAQSPVAGGKLKTVDEKAALAVKGVRQVLKLDNAVAVVADHMWAAKQGLAAAAPTWDDGEHAGVTTASIDGGDRAGAGECGVCGDREADSQAAGRGAIEEGVSRSNASIHRHTKNRHPRDGEHP